jgi:hypothetical protein
MLKRIQHTLAHLRFRQLLLELVVSVCLACLVWLYIHNRIRNSIDRVAVPVAVQLAAHQRDQFVIEAPESRSVMVSFTGAQALIRDLRRKLQRGMLKANITLTVSDEKKSEAMFTETLHVDEDAIVVPVGVKAEIDDDSVPITVHRLTERTLPVKFEFAGDALVSDVKIEPASVLVRGPKTVLDRASFMPTKPYAIQANAEKQATAEANVHGQVGLVTELDGRTIHVDCPSVQFHCRAVPKQKIYELVDVPVHFLAPKESPWQPHFGNDKDGKVTLKLIGPATDQPPPVLAFVDLTRGNLARGRNLEPLRLQLPKDFQLVQPTTSLVTFYLEEISRPMP